MTENFNFDALVELCRQTHEELRSRAIRSVDIAIAFRYVSPGRDGVLK